MGAPVVINPPERFAIRTLARDLTFEGPSALLLPNGSLRCGMAADAALQESRTHSTSRPSTSSAYGSGGLLLIHSHRQGTGDFALFARMLEVIRAMPAGSMKASKALPQNQSASILLDDLSLLIVNNNAVRQTATWSSAEHPVRWLRHFGSWLRLRMLLLTTINVYARARTQTQVSARAVVDPRPCLA